MERSGPRFETHFLVTGPSEDVFAAARTVAEQFASRPVFAYAVESDGQRIAVRRRFLPWHITYAGLVGCLLLVGFVVLLVVRNDEILTITVVPEAGDLGSRITVSGAERGFYVDSSMLTRRTRRLSKNLERALGARRTVVKEKRLLGFGGS